MNITLPFPRNTFHCVIESSSLNKMLQSNENPENIRDSDLLLF